jgi:hypothetical protein
VHVGQSLLFSPPSVARGTLLLALNLVHKPSLYAEPHGTRRRRPD